MESELRSLIGKYGIRAVHEGLMKEMQDTYSYLQSIFPAKNEIILPSVQHNKPTVEIVNNTIPDQIVSEIKSYDNDSIDESVPAMPSDPTIKTVTVTKGSAKQMKPTVEVKQPKQEHREQVDAKRQELLAKGIKPENLLTEENLRKWISQGLSYQKIAKETGVHEVQVSNVCKSFGLQSNISKYVAMKKAS